MVTSTAEQWATFITVSGSHLFLIRLTRPPPLPAARARPVALRLPVHIYPLLFQALLFPSSLQRPHRKTAAWSSPTPHPLPGSPFHSSEVGPLVCHQPTLCTDEPGLVFEGPSLDPLLGQAEGSLAVLLQPVQKLWLLGPDPMVASGTEEALSEAHQLPDPALSWGRGAGPWSRKLF